MNKKIQLDFCTKELDEKYKDDIYLKRHRELKEELLKYEEELYKEYNSKN